MFYLQVVFKQENNFFFFFFFRKRHRFILYYKHCQEEIHCILYTYRNIIIYSPKIRCLKECLVQLRVHVKWSIFTPNKLYQFFFFKSKRVSNLRKLCIYLNYDIVVSVRNSFQLNY